jgi:DNA-binding transcriptional LysR family regulator
MSDRLEALRLFVRVARLGGFSAAAREMRMPQSTASRTIANLEREIGVTLLVRTTRAVTLTEAGADFLARVEGIIHDLDEAEHAARGDGELRGLLRVGLGTGLGTRLVIPRLKPFYDRHPKLQVELLLDDQHQDLVTEGVDVALRFGKLADSIATVRRLRIWERVMAASPGYLAGAPPLTVPADLAAHSVIVGAQGGGEWVLRKGGTTASIRIEGRLRIPAFEGAMAAALNDMGIVLTSTGASRRELDSGSLVRILPDWDLGAVELHAIYTGGRTAKPSVRAFVAFLAEALADT